MQKTTLSILITFTFLSSYSSILARRNGISSPANSGASSVNTPQPITQEKVHDHYGNTYLKFTRLEKSFTHKQLVESGCTVQTAWLGIICVQAPLYNPAKLNKSWGYKQTFMAHARARKKIGQEKLEQNFTQSLQEEYEKQQNK